jgi:hypothetical protein
MCCVFIDFEKASDIVWREGLWCALLMNHINGKIQLFTESHVSGTIPESNIQLNNLTLIGISKCADEVYIH